jgi:heme/copper-type cytochrome/quinol oxidase subunit 4
MRRSSIENRRAVAVWAVLVTATMASWLLGAHDPVGRTASTVAVIVIAFVKVRLVGVHFMCLDRAPRPLRLTFDTWVVGAGAMVVGLYLWA